MRFDRLALQKIGPFEGVELDLSGGDCGLHLIYGVNEAGKSTLLRALSYLLFGFPGQIEDNWRFPNPDLRIGAALRRRDGAAIQFVRRKGNKNTLRDGDDDKVIEERELAAFLDGLTAETFQYAYGINADALRKGGEAIASGKGESGAILFAAHSGIAGIQEILQRLQHEADELFKPSGKKQPLATALSEWKAARQTARSLQLTGQTWQDAVDAVESAEKQSQAVKERLNGAIRRRALLGRVQDAQRIAAAIERLRGELETLADAPRLDENASAVRIDVEARLESAQESLNQRLADMRRIDAELERIVVDRSLLDRGPEIAALHGDLSAVRKAARDAVERKGQMIAGTHEIHEILRQLKRPVDLSAEELEKLRPAHDLDRRLHRQSEERATILAELATIEQALAENESRRSAFKKRLSESLDAEPEALKSAHAIARSALPFVDRFRQLACDLALKTEQRDSLLQGLAGPHRTIPELASISPPTEEDLDRFDDQLKEAEKQLLDARNRLAHARKVHQEKDRLLKQEMLRTPAPGPEELATSRRKRETGWRLVLAEWRGPKGLPAETDEFISSCPPAADLAAAYELAVRQADAVADAMTEHADLIARRERLRLDLRHAAEDVESARQELEHTEREHAARRDCWNRVVATLGGQDWSVPQTRSWIRLRNELLQIEADRAALKGAAAATRTSILEAGRRLAGPLGIDPESTSVDILPAWTEQAEAILAEFESKRRARMDAENRLSEWNQESERLTARREAALRRLEQWRASWSGTMEELGLPSDALPETAVDFCELLRKLFVCVSQVSQFEKRLKGIDRDRRNFSERARALAQSVAPELADRVDEAIAEELHARLEINKAAAQRRESLLQTSDEIGQAVEKTQGDIEQLKERLKKLCRQAHVARSEDLPEAERRARRRLEAERELAGLELEYGKSAAGVDRIVFDKLVKERLADDLAAEIRELDEDIERLDEERSDADRQLGQRRSELSKLEQGNANALEAIEDAERHLASAVETARRFALLKTAAFALRTAIDRYRERNQGPVIGYAARLFSRLTAGSFSGLKVDVNDNGQPCLVAVRDNRLVYVHQLSDGARDQLFLALRLAAILAGLDDGREPIPFVVDDLFLTFDDERAAEGLLALAELSDRTQVLMMTHHRHLVELARDRVPAERLFIHALSPAS